MSNTDKMISSGLTGLDQILNGLFIGDNVVWYDDAGSQVSDFFAPFIQESLSQGKFLVYVSFDRSPKNLIEKLGPLARSQQLIILDCFTNGKGDKSLIFKQFYEKDDGQWPCQVIKVTYPQSPQAVSDAVYGLHETLTGDVRFVFESLTGMADLWDGESHILKFYSHTCPKLYELDTIAYWVMEKGAHSEKIKAHINQVAQVVVDLSNEQGRSRIKVLKAENRSPRALGKFLYYTMGQAELVFEDRQHAGDRYDIGSAIKNFRKSQGMPQKKLSKLVGVTPSNISQIESSQIFPSIPALFKIAEHLSVDAGSFFQKKKHFEKAVFSPDEGTEIPPGKENKKQLKILQITPFDHFGKVDVFMVELSANCRLGAHFFQHKGEEIGYLLSGKVEMTLQNQAHTIISGDTIYLKTDAPTRWQGKSKEKICFLWMKVN